MTYLYEQFLRAFAGSAGQLALGGITLAVLGVGYVFGLKFLSKNARDARFLTVILRMAKSLLSERLGERGNAVFDALLSGLAAIQSGEFSQDTIAEQLTQFIKSAVIGKFDMTESDLDVVRYIAKSVVSFIEPRKKAAPEAVKVMMMMQAQ